MFHTRRPRNKKPEIVKRDNVTFVQLKKVLILCAHRPGRSPSQRYRFEQYIPFLEKKDFRFQFSFLLNEKDDRTFYSRGNFISKAFILVKSVLKRRKDARTFKNYDFILIQREAGFLGNSYFEKKAFQSGAIVIFDFDDSIWLADTSPGNKKWEWIKEPGKFFENVKNAHIIIAGNEYLAEKARQVNSNVVVIPTTVDTDLHFPKPELRGKNIVTIGWSGSISTIKHFELLLPVLKRLKEKFGQQLRFKVLGAPGYHPRSLDVESVAWTEKNEVEVLNTFDIGLMPLPDDEWAKGKCGLKALTYMACEIPAVVSNVGVNSSIIKHGENGFLAKNDEEWFNFLSMLISEPKLRSELGIKGRQTVIDNYSVSANKEKYLDVFSRR